MAPEVLQGKGYTLSSEWWAFGCLIYELLVGIPPFFVSQSKATSRPTNRHDLYKLINNSTPQLDLRHLGSDARDLLSRLLCKDPSERLGSENVEDIMNHKWFSDVNWD